MSKENLIITKSESGDTLRLPKEVLKAYKKAVFAGDEDTMIEIESKYYYPDND